MGRDLLRQCSTLSAILVDDDYYHFIHAGRHTVNGLSAVRPEYLIPLKARACLDLVKRQEAGEQGLSDGIKKHTNDVFRLFQVIEPDFHESVAPKTRSDMGEFISRASKEPLDMKSMGLRSVTL